MIGFPNVKAEMCDVGITSVGATSTVHGERSPPYALRMIRLTCNQIDKLCYFAISIDGVLLRERLTFENVASELEALGVSDPWIVIEAALEHGAVRVDPD